MLQKKIKICLLIAISFILLFCGSNFSSVVYANESPAKAMCVLEGNSKRVLYSKNCDEKLPMASTTKIITAITVLENFKGNLDERVVVPSDAVGIEGTSIYIRKEEKLSVRELLYGLMLPSGNDCATALAILISGSESAFCDLMRQTARKAGACDSNFINAHGLDVEGHYTTARDLSLITAYALKNQEFKTISKANNYIIPQTEKSEERYLTNKNKLLRMREDCIGVKIGFTTNAGRCLVGAIEKDGCIFICTVLNCGPMFAEVSSLLDKAKDEYSMQEILEPYKYVTSLSVSEGQSNYTRVFCEEGFTYPLNQKEKESLSIEYEYEQNLVAPVDKNQMVGNVKVYADNCLLFTTKICTMDSVEKQSANESLQDIIDRWL